MEAMGSIELVSSYNKKRRMREEVSLCVVGVLGEVAGLV